MGLAARVAILYSLPQLPAWVDRREKFSGWVRAQFQAADNESANSNPKPPPVCGPQSGNPLTEGAPTGSALSPPSRRCAATSERPDRMTKSRPGHNHAQGNGLRPSTLFEVAAGEDLQWAEYLAMIIDVRAHQG